NTSTSLVNFVLYYLPMLFYKMCASLSVVPSFPTRRSSDLDLARSYTRLINQIRSALVDCYPQFEQALRGQIIHRKWVLHLLPRYGGPTKIKRLGKAKAAAFARC